MIGSPPAWIIPTTVAAVALRQFDDPLPPPHQLATCRCGYHRFDIAHMARAMSLLGLISGLGSVLAPQVGSAVLLLVNWRLEFWLLTAMGSAALIAAFSSLPESVPVKGRRIGPRTWFKLMTDRRYLHYAIPANLVTYAAFAYISGASFVFIDHFNMSPQQFGWAFGVNSIGLMIGSRINAQIVSRIGAETLFRRAVVCSAVLGVILFGIAAADWGGFWGLMIPLFFLITCLGFLFSNGLALSLMPSGNSAGTVAALLGGVHLRSPACPEWRSAHCTTAQHGP